MWRGIGVPPDPRGDFWTDVDIGAAIRTFNAPALSLLVHALMSERRVLILGL